MGAFVTIHGIDGTGKTTIAKTISQAFQAEFVMSYYFEDLDIPRQPVNVTNETNGYQRSVLKKIGQSAVVRDVVEKGGLISKDRWMIDVAASNSYGNDRHYTKNPEGVLLPHLAVFLTCEEDERMRRIQARGNPTPDDLIPNEPGTRAFYFEQFLLQNMGDFSITTTVIDTTHGSVEAVVDQVKGALSHDARF